VENKQYPFYIDPKLCKKCGLCTAFCPTKVYITGEDDLPKIEHPEKCISCKMCFYRCPDFAIRLKPEVA